MTDHSARVLLYSALIFGLFDLGCRGEETYGGPLRATRESPSQAKPRAADSGKAATGERGTRSAAEEAEAGATRPTTYPDLRGRCDIHSDYGDDAACLSAPSPDEGIQLHVGPSNYDDPEEVAKYLLMPGEEVSECWTFRTPNDEEVWYQTSVLSGRMGTHHIINTLYEGGAFEDGGFRRCGGDGVEAIGTLPGASKAYMPRGHVAPEYSHVGRKIPARATVQADMHYFNFTDKPIIREYWLNIYFAKAEDIEQEALQIRGLGGVGWRMNPIEPGTDKVYQYECPVKGDGYILNLLGHYHAHGKRFTASIQRAEGGDPEKVFEMFDYQDPAVFEYNSLIENPMFAESTAGAVSGQLAVHEGDILKWECHVINDSDTPLRYTNEVNTGEMCNLWGSSLGIEQFVCVKP